MTAAVLGPSKPFNIVVTHLYPDLVGRSTGRHDKYIVLPKAQHLHEIQGLYRAYSQRWFPWSGQLLLCRFDQLIVRYCRVL